MQAIYLTRSQASAEKNCTFLFYLYFYFVFTIFLFFQYSCLHYPATIFPRPTLSPSPALATGPLYVFLDDPFPSFLLSPTSLPSAYCQFVLNFYVSGYILLTCLFC